MNRPDEILQALKHGERGAFETFFEEYHGSLLLFATRVLNDADAAADVVQECFVNFWAGRRYEQVSGSLEHYMFHAVKNGALKYLRDQRRRALRHENATRESGREPPPTPEEEITLETERLYAAIHRLPAERRRVFTMVCVEGMKYQEVADSLDISLNTVKKQMTRAFHFLREALKERPFPSLLLFLLKKNLFPVTRTRHRGIL
jgi:RNA polymerase sigma-70 factor (ECF subfamily)